MVFAAQVTLSIAIFLALLLPAMRGVLERDWRLAAFSFAGLLLWASWYVLTVDLVRETMTSR